MGIVSQLFFLILTDNYWYHRHLSWCYRHLSWYHWHHSWRNSWCLPLTVVSIDMILISVDIIFSSTSLSNISVESPVNDYLKWLWYQSYYHILIFIRFDNICQTYLDCLTLGLSLLLYDGTANFDQKMTVSFLLC